MRWSPEQICQALRDEFPDRPEMHVSHETIYQAIYVQGRGELRRELARCLRTGRAVRRPQRQARAAPVAVPAPMVMISERPAEVEDRAVPGHWEGDLIIGTNGQSAIGTLVERSTRYVMLAHLPDGHTAEPVRDALVAHRSRPCRAPAPVADLGPGHGDGRPPPVHRSPPTSPVYFCDPARPWQRGSNENTNGLLRQYFPKGTDLSVHSRDDLGPSPQSSTAAHAKRSAGKPQPSASLAAS